MEILTVAKEYDLILAGGGTAACVVAGRLAQADPALSILVLEQGQNNIDNTSVQIPALFPSNLVPSSKTALFYRANKETALNGRELNVATAQGCDFDSWNTKGWGADSILPFAKKLETYHGNHPEVDKNLHGYDGPVNISRGTYEANVAQEDIIAGAKAVGIEEVVDMQDFKAAHGISRFMRYIGPDGRRQDAAHAYVHPLIQSGKYPNLDLQLESTVTRVVFEGSKATGVEYQSKNSDTTSANTSYFVKARKMVVLSSGALGTPQILERSGVGNADHLKALGIPVVSDLPGVGENYQDHNLIGFPYKTTLSPEQTLDSLLGGQLSVPSAIKERNPILGWNGCDLAAKLRPTEKEVEQLGPAFQDIWNRDFKDRPERPLMLIAVLNLGFPSPQLISEAVGGPCQSITMGCYSAYPYSRGRIHITSKDANDPPSLTTGILSHPADIKMLLWAYKKQREIFRRTNCYDGELPFRQPKFREGSKAIAPKEQSSKVRFRSVQERRDLPLIEYDAEDDAAIEETIRDNVGTTWHSLGTCKMAGREEGGVVDADLNVHGTKRLKIADLSICPENVAANTNNTALIIGEKAAWIIGKELGISIPL